MEQVEHGNWPFGHNCMNFLNSSRLLCSTIDSSNGLFLHLSASWFCMNYHHNVISSLVLMMTSPNTGMHFLNGDVGWEVNISTDLCLSFVFPYTGYPDQWDPISFSVRWFFCYVQWPLFKQKVHTLLHENSSPKKIKRDLHVVIACHTSGICTSKKAKKQGKGHYPFSVLSHSKI